MYDPIYLKVFAMSNTFLIVFLWIERNNIQKLINDERLENSVI